jgi:hypothetical protein
MKTSFEVTSARLSYGSNTVREDSLSFLMAEPYDTSNMLPNPWDIVRNIGESRTSSQYCDGNAISSL